MRSLAQHQASYRSESAVVLAILPVTVEALPDIQAEVGPGINLLADSSRRVRTEYAALIDEDPDQADMLFVLDRYGTPLVAATGQTAGPDIHEEIIHWLTYAEIRCPE